MKTLIYTVSLSLLLLGNAVRVQAQRPWKEYLIPGTAMLFAGFIEGTDEALVYHYQNGFKRALPGVSDKFWNPAISYKNKFKNLDQAQGEAFLGSTNVFVELTDGHHLLRLSRVAMDLTAITYCANKQHPREHKVQFINWRTVAQDFLVLSVVRTIGFHIAYDGVFYGAPDYLAKK